MFDHREVFALIESDPGLAVGVIENHLRDTPNDGSAYYLLGVVNNRADRQGTALAAFERATRLSPHRAEAWNGYGMALLETHQPVQAREAFRRALSIKEDAAYMNNMGASYLEDANHQEAMRWAKKALAKDPDHSGARATMGFAQLATGDWKNGWQGFEAVLGGKFRKAENFTGEPKWDGSPVDSLVIYGEQGLGDEIMYASILGDAQKHAKQITLQCDKRLEGLFRRSFPEVEVFGTRREEPTWAEGRKFDAGCAIGSLAALFRPNALACPKTPYLKADPERRLQWRALFDSWKKPVIGICWSGGRAATQKMRRAVGLEAFRPLIEKTDAVFVSLQYQDAAEEIEQSGLPVRHIPRAVQSPDYDDTAAFVAELDQIVGVHTTVHHLAGALGKPSTILVPSKPMWNFAYGDRSPWYANNVYHRQKKDESWADCIRRV